ncbi:hypothetical protein NP493_15g07053 [Ridgeia piscesae]|uniref:Uncharacterized protein n=1 Tax=Ridgeia piscesae TaxID=27915 RepID=A0AAD9UKY6_RIDPI|nr:hypothetical protein NP493_15g07053 [Ridgeia piscesae]
MSGPIYNNNGLRCPRGVLTNDDSHRKQCFVTVRGIATPSHDIQELQEGTFAILSPGEPFKCYCAGQASITGILQPGLSVLTVKPRCRISGQSWTLQRLYKATSTLAWKLLIITVHPFNLSTMVSHTAITKLFPLQRGNRCLSCQMLNYTPFSKCRTTTNFRILIGMVMWTTYCYSCCLPLQVSAPISI